MVKEFKEIDVPNPEKGLTEKQRDRLRVDMANGINHIGETVKDINGEVQKHRVEIYGDENSAGLKGKVHSNSKLIHLLIKIVIISTIGGGAVLGITSTVGGI